MSACSRFGVYAFWGLRVLKSAEKRWWRCEPVSKQTHENVNIYVKVNPIKLGFPGI